MADFKSKSLIETTSPSMLHKIRLISPDDCPLLQEVLRQYNLVDEQSNILEKAACTIYATILMQERIYFNLTLRDFRKLIEKDPNHKFPVAFHNRSWPKILAFLYNQLSLIELVQQGSWKTASTYRVKDKDVANFLLNERAIDAKAQKAEALEFTNKRFKPTV